MASETPTQTLSPIAARIEAARQARGMSQAELSVRAGLSQSTLNDLVRHPDRSPRVTTVEQIAKVLKVPVAHILGLEVVSEPSELQEVSASDLDGRVQRAWYDAMIETHGPVRIFQVARPTAVSGRQGSLIAAGSEPPKSGNLVIAAMEPGIFALRYFAEPYLFGPTQNGSTEHTTIGMARVVGPHLGTLLAQP